jgi:bifunctional non-homologous end joining protein LigD
MAKKALALYQAKRDFKKTPEPRGKAAVRRGNYPRFVVQKHAASRLHYDLRLEVDGVFKSWAVTKGPSPDPADKRLAVEVEDHPLDYGDFEGTIPKGEYGGGTVMLWDRGFWRPEGTADPARALRAGELKFSMAGKKLQGGWVLVRMQRKGERAKANTWLLIKHRDGFERQGDASLLAQDRSVASGRSMQQIAEGRGRGPQPFMEASEQRAGPGAQWISAKDAKGSNAKAKRPRPRSTHMPATHSDDDGAVVLGVTISKPDKELWPATETSEPFTKLDLARYLAQVGPWMMEHMRGRPCSILRAPDGINGERFFQRHAMPGLSKLVTLTTVGSHRKPYLGIDRLEALIALAQVATVEFHPWNSAPGQPDRPGRLIFDLDPGSDVTFAAVIAAAKELRERLEQLGLVAFLKTTGGKGLHVVTPLKLKGDAPDWLEAKRFAQAVCSEMAHDQPDRYLVNMRKDLRAGRIYLDYLRNDQTSTAVGPLSPRARPGAPVSMPLTWSQLREGLDPGRFTLASAPGLIGKSSAWKDYAEAARPLGAASRKLASKHRAE